jgi:hypothetical protein
MSYILVALLAAIATLFGVGAAAKKYPKQFDAAVTKVRGQ